MSVLVKYQRARSKSEAFNIIKKTLTPDIVSKFNVAGVIHHDDHKPSTKVEAKGIKFDLQFLEDSAAFTLEVPFILKPLRNKAINKIEELLLKVL